jgi:predicted DNA-binding transcriptional regulator YafY
MPAADQLERILYVLPMAARGNGVTFEELSLALSCDVATILEDIEEATARVFYHPAGTVDPFEIMIEAGRVRVHAPADFKRPVRLSDREGLALGLGLRALAAEAEPGRRAEILALAAQLEDSLVAPHIALQPSIARDAPVTATRPSFEVATGTDDVRADIADAIERAVLCEIEYMKPHSAPSRRTIAPRQLVHAHGHWYVAAIEDGEQKVFRLDRITDHRVLDEAIDEAAVRASHYFYLGTDADLQARVRYSPRIGRWIAEQNDSQCDADGSCVIVHRVSDVNWLVRHVLQYGGEAVVETEELRGFVARAAAGLIA